MSPQPNEARRTQSSQPSRAEELTAKLKQFIENSNRAGSQFPWEVGKQLHVISAAYVNGEFSIFMENLRANVGIPKNTGYDYLRQYRSAVKLFPPVVIDAMLEKNLLPNKKKVIQAAGSDSSITDLLKGIAELPPDQQKHWALPLVDQIRQAAARIKNPKIGKAEAFVKAACTRFPLLLSENDEFYKKPAKAMTSDQLQQEESSLLNALGQLILRFNLVTNYPDRIESVRQTAAKFTEWANEDRQI